MLQPVELVSKLVTSVIDALDDDEMCSDSDLIDWYVQTAHSLGSVPNQAVLGFIQASYSDFPTTELTLAGQMSTDIDVALALGAIYLSPTPLTLVNLSSTGIGNLAVEMLVAGFNAQRLATLEQMCLRGNDLGDRRIASIVRSLANAPELNHLDISGCSITESGISVFLDVGKGGVPSLHTLALDMNPLGHKGGAILGRLITVIPVSKLYLGSCGLGDAGAEMLSKGLRHSELEEVILWDNAIGDQGAKAFAHAIADMPEEATAAPAAQPAPQPTHTKRPSGALSSTAPRRLAIPATPSMNRTLPTPTFGASRRLSLTDSPACRTGSLSSTADFSKTNSAMPSADVSDAEAEDDVDTPPVAPLTVLALWNNRIGSVGAAALAQAMVAPGAAKLASLDLSGNPIGNNGIALMEGSLGKLCASQREATLAAFEGKTSDCRHPCRVWDLAQIGLTGEGIHCVVRALRMSNTDRPPMTTLTKSIDWSTLTTLNLHGNNLQDSGIIILMGGVRSCLSLSRLILSQTMFSHAGLAAIAALLTVRPTVTHLDISCNRLTDEALSVLVRRVGTVKLHSLVLDHNNLGDTSVTALAESLVNHPTLHHISLAHNKLGLVAAVALEQALEQYNVLQVLNVSGNPLPATSQTSLCHAVVRLWARQKHAGIPALTCDLVREKGFEPDTMVARRGEETE
ncbi:Leucine Rich repeat [Carpediemonas membranifera]|uniref:Leucine Rich repeat n=1 Tax=Carpediemonas membranifera TaxID=201153 RepID=A0A8J6C1J4_9EUKA|nr:Leucine Rich repeat [Carpediemonas membranifera]|eukprot:KAG9397641.1 Leucine Rich repeat [Carpediemonas membranifera]